MIRGIEIQKLPWENLKKVGVLQFTEFPSTIVYSNSDKTPYIIEWVDLNEAGKDVYFIYESSVDNLKKYIQRDISHYDLIIAANGGIALKYTGELKNATSFFISPVNDIPLDLMPSYDSLFSQKYSGDLQNINKYFDLPTHQITALVVREVAVDKYTPVFSKQYNTELIHLHLNEGELIEHGKVRTDVLANTLLRFENLYHEIATDYIRGGKERYLKIDTTERKAQFKDLAYTEVVLEKAASFSIYIKPRTSTPQLMFTADTSTPLTQAEVIFNNVKEVISNAFTADSIGALTDKYNPAVFSKLKEFAEIIANYNIDIDIDYFSPVSKTQWKDNIELNKADSIITTLKSEVKETESIEVIGKFSALNCKTRHFAFVSNDNTEYIGYFDETIKESIPTLNFIEIYEVKIEQSKAKMISESEFKVQNKIIATYPYKKKK
ncbi:MAG TPA: hypothetical protein VK808_05300 [Bacteroidia bacterium]|jgi:hypothetical protein|nr:hypothetical protein [Bacteroidia bacterium]